MFGVIAPALNDIMVGMIADVCERIEWHNSQNDGIA